MIRYPLTYNPILEYNAAIENGQVVVSKKVATVYRKLAQDVVNGCGDYAYKAKRANHAIEFIENYCRHSKGKAGGKPFILELWQKALVAAMFGFVHVIDGTRKYREVLLVVARKNGKSTLSAAIGLYLMVADGEPGAEIYAVATKKDQAKIIWQEARRMVCKSPVLHWTRKTPNGKIKPLVAEMVSDFNDSVYKPLGHDSDTQDGLNVHGGLLDEIHAFAYTDVIHLRNDYNENDVFGTPPGPALQSVMEVIGTTDRSIINAVRNGAVIRWLLKFTSSGMRPEDIKKQTKDFADAFLDNNNSTGVAGTDVKADAVQLEPHDYVPNALQSQNNITRLYSFFNTNEKIVKSSFSENEWISYYEAQVEPDLLQIAAEHTRKLWNRRQRAFGNKLYLESSNLQYASMSTKLSLESMVDRGAMLPNEWRAVFGLAPVAGGDEPIRRLDTAPVKQTKSGGETE